MQMARKLSKKIKETSTGNLYNLSEEEIAEMIKEGRKEHEEGKTVVLSSPEEIRSCFEKMMEERD